jgi:serine/threonine protein kinase
MIEAETYLGVSLSIPRQFANYRVQKVIGQGTMCVVLEIVDRHIGKDYAAKVMSYLDLNDHRLIPMVERELKILRRLSHDRVVRFHEYVRLGDLMFIIMENIVGSDLLSGILEGRTRDKLTLKRLFYDVACGVQYIHNAGIAHNDIKPENIMVDCSGRAKLIDFGCAKESLTAGDNGKDGTLAYAAPELFKRGSYNTQKADVWSLAILLYSMATGKLPFSEADDRHIVRKSCHGKLRFPRTMDRGVETLIKRMAKVNPNERPTLDAVLENPFFDEVRISTKCKDGECQSTEWCWCPNVDAHREFGLW